MARSGSSSSRESIDSRESRLSEPAAPTAANRTRGSGSLAARSIAFEHGLDTDWVEATLGQARFVPDVAGPLTLDLDLAGVEVAELVMDAVDEKLHRRLLLQDVPGLNKPGWSLRTVLVFLQTAEPMPRLIHQPVVTGASSPFLQ